MLMRLSHHSRHLGDEMIGYQLMEQVGHRVDEDSTRLLPLEWIVEPIRVENDILGSELSSPRLLRPPEPEGKGLRIAVTAALGDLGAAGDRIPGRVGPLNRRV